jgi:hypothetical protein
VAVLIIKRSVVCGANRSALSNAITTSRNFRDSGGSPVLQGTLTQHGRYFESCGDARCANNAKPVKPADMALWKRFQSDAFMGTISCGWANNADT